MEHTAADLLAKIARVLSSEGIYAVISFRSEPLLRRLFDCRYLPFGPLEHVELRAQSGEPASLYRVRRLAGQSASLDQRLEHLVAMAARLDARAAALDQREAEMDEEVDSETDDVEAIVPMFRVRAPVVPQVRSSNLPPVQGVPVAVVEEAAAEEVEQAGQEQDVNEATGERLGGSD